MSSIFIDYLRKNGQAIPDEEAATIIRAAYLHDIGKMNIGVSQDMVSRRKEALTLLQKSNLTDQELGLIQEHAMKGYEMLNLRGFPKEALLIRHHHENYDGSGYPDGLVGDAIPFGARLIRIVDSWDAMMHKRMTHDRPSSEAFTKDEAIAGLLKGAGTLYDPLLVKFWIDFIGQTATAPKSSELETPAGMRPGIRAWSDYITAYRELEQAGNDKEKIKAAREKMRNAMVDKAAPEELASGKDTRFFDDFLISVVNENLLRAFEPLTAEAKDLMWLAERATNFNARASRDEFLNLHVRGGTAIVKHAPVLYDVDKHYDIHGILHDDILISAQDAVKATLRLEKNLIAAPGWFVSRSELNFKDRFARLERDLLKAGRDGAIAALRNWNLHRWEDPHNEVPAGMYNPEPFGSAAAVVTPEGRAALSTKYTEQATVDEIVRGLERRFESKSMNVVREWEYFMHSRPLTLSEAELIRELQRLLGSLNWLLSLANMPLIVLQTGMAMNMRTAELSQTEEVEILSIRLLRANRIHTRLQQEAA